MQRPLPRALILFALVGGIVAFIVAALGSTVIGLVAGILCLAIATAGIVWGTKADTSDAPHDLGRRRFLAWVGLGGLAWVFVGDALGRAARKLSLPDPRPVQEAMAHDLGAEYMELVRRAYRPGRSGDLQLLLAPFNSSNYSNESVSLVPQDPRTSHASTWMYLERVPLLVHAPGFVEPSDDTTRVTLANIPGTIARLIGYDNWPIEREGSLPAISPPPKPPKVVVTFVIDGGGWNVLQQWPDAWPTMKRLMSQSANYRNAIHGSFPAVTATAHATIGTGAFPRDHGITGHNIRDAKKVRKAYGVPGSANPGDILIPTLADLWSDATDNRAWVGEIGYQIWHLGMLGYGGRSRTGDQRPVAVFWDEDGDVDRAAHDWRPQNQELFRMPAGAPTLETLAKHQSSFIAPDWDSEFDPKGKKAVCCSPPIVRYQGDLIEATLRNEPIGRSGTTDLLFINFKTPDYTGHVYNMLSKWEALVLQQVDAELDRVWRILEERFPGEYALIVTADHGQCPLPDTVDGVRLDPIQLGNDIEAKFGGGLFNVVQSVVPSEVYLHSDVLWDNGATVEDVAASLADYRYRQNIGPYVPRNAIEQDLLDQKEFAAVFATSFLKGLPLVDLSTFGETTFNDGDPFGIPKIRSRMTVDLTADDRAMLDGERGEAAVLAMRILIEMANVWEAERLIDVASAHVDSCLYHGQSGLDFADRLVAGGARVTVPTTLNVASLDLLHPELVRLDAEMAGNARRLMDSYVAMGCRPTWTCAPYQLQERPSFGEHVAWAESNAIVFANSVLGARTNRYGDFIDVCAAITGRAPEAGLHLDANRRARVVFRLEGIPDRLLHDEVTPTCVGHIVGSDAGADVAAIVGLPADTSEDRLKALGAAAASSGAVAMFHAVDITPEAPTLEAALGGLAPKREIIIRAADLRAARDELTTSREGPIGAVSVGTPHLSAGELARLERLVGDARPSVPFYANAGRDIAADATTLARAGVTLVTDTCTYITPIIHDIQGPVMTNSAKWAWYAPANLGFDVVFGSLEECVRSAALGRVWRDVELWGDRDA